MCIDNLGGICSYKFMNKKNPDRKMLITVRARKGLHEAIKAMAREDAPVAAPVTQPTATNDQLLKSYEAVWDEKEAVYAKLQEVLDNPRDEVATYWKNKYEELVERAKALEALS